MTKAITAIKWLIGALLGYLMVSFISISIIGEIPLLAGVLGIVAAIYSGVYAKKHLAILFLAFIAIYAGSFWNTTRKINKFCESINASTKPSDLIQLSEQAGIEFRVSEIRGVPGKFYGLAPNVFTIGEHTCQIHFTKEKIISEDEVYSTKPSDLIKSSEQAGVGLNVGEIKGAPGSTTAKSAKVSVWFEQSFWNGDSHIHAIFTQTPHINEDGTTANCYACGAVIGVVTYKQENGKWEFISMQPEFAELGRWGYAPNADKLKLLRLAPGNVAVLIHETSLNQEIYTSWIDLFAFSKSQWRNLSPKGVVVDYEDCSDLLPSKEHEKELGRCWRYKGKVSLRAGKYPEYPDLLLTQTRTIRGKGKPHGVPANRVITYSFNGYNYIVSKADYSTSKSN